MRGKEYRRVKTSTAAIPNGRGIGDIGKVKACFQSNLGIQATGAYEDKENQVFFHISCLKVFKCAYYWCYDLFRLWGVTPGYGIENLKVIYVGGIGANLPGSNGSLVKLRCEDHRSN